MADLVAENKVIGIAYSLFDAEGNLVDEAPEEEPLYYIHGAGQLLPKVEETLSGKEPGYSTTLELTAADAYGEYDERLVAEVEKSKFPASLELEIGMKFDTMGPDNEPMMVEVVEIEDETVIVDGNHPLAGEDLRFEIRVLTIREATQEELEHGHAHGPSGQTLH